jgi:iron complex transport system ATP-binding protein
LEGSGSTYLWTKNALERNGYVVDDAATLSIKINNQQLTWEYDKKLFTKLETLIRQLP